MTGWTKFSCSGSWWWVVSSSSPMASSSSSPTAACSAQAWGTSHLLEDSLLLEVFKPRFEDFNTADIEW
ncbi:unnamed protein product [Caretta caretta]